jgi:hypothetical protein
MYLRKCGIIHRKEKMEYIILLLIVVGGILLYWVLANFLEKRPLPVTEIRHEIKGVFMKVAEVRVFWERSVSADIVHQLVDVSTYTDGDDEGTSLTHELGPTVSEVVLEVPENTSVNVAHQVFDGTYHSEVVAYDFRIGDLTAPQPAGFIGHEIVRVFERE